MIPVNEPLLDGNELKYLTECIATGWVSSEGPFVERFEKGMAVAAGRRHGIALCNGTAALETALSALQFEPGDQIIMPTFTIISCAVAVIRSNCTPVFVDSDPLTWNMDVGKLTELVVNEIEHKKNKRLKAIMIVHTYGLPVDMGPILELAKQYGLKIIEDASQMHGQTYYGKPCGSFGDVSTFSFYSNKHITSGEGGMVVTDDDDLAARCRSLRNLGFQQEKRFVHEEIGYNFRLSNLQAAVGVAQLERLGETIKRKREMGNRYAELLKGVEGLEHPLASVDYAENIYWVYGLVLKGSVRCDAETLMRRMAERGVGTRPFFWPMHEQPVLKKLALAGEGTYPVAERLARRGFYIPSGVALTAGQMDETAAILGEELNSIGSN